ncbi:MAG: tRNA pseudouridine(13) synthase TruD [Candidatus Hodarchaeota archaeon]
MSKNYSVESLVGINKYSTPRFRGMGGIIKQKNEDFVVREIPPSGKPIFTGSEIGDDQGGMYIHCVLWKSGLDTFNAIKKLSFFLGLNESDIGYAGLKDAYAETFQRISIWNLDIESVKKINFSDLKLFHPIRQRFAIRIGDLVGNYFEVIIRDIEREWTSEEWNSFQIQMESNGILNYYGIQRFGSKRPILHLIGKLLLQKRYPEIIKRYIGDTSALEHENITQLRMEYLEASSYTRIRDQFPKKYSIERMLLTGLLKGFPAKKNVLRLPKYFLRLSISAYQAYIFNRILSSVNVDNIVSLKDLRIPLPGYQSKKQETSEKIWNILLTMLEADIVDFNNFKHEKPSLSSKGSTRKAIIFPTKINNEKISTEKKAIKISFALPKGSYATILTREIIKEESKVS